MSAQLILCFIAADKPGLVDALSKAISECGGNWLESRMAHMAEKFTGIIRVELPDRERAEGLMAQLATLERDGFNIMVSDAREQAEPTGSPLEIDLVGSDQPGIVQDITHCLATHRVSIEKMDTYTADAPMGGGILFHAHFDLRAPSGFDEAALHAELEQLANALMVDLDLHERDAVAAKPG
ncbi:glycine cleavage system protein R [Oricola cellulosilytica]|uniref:Glycine cleavage system protein R n=1 Tax=Oricola cellulosilytica TaxID=1429082 RepID=A0A4R0PDK3_9HYPH|nr:ACT domain-containing protein [Oricola cellulosilytica]TCD14409.1 glycine cleavage system protein R [Oricola cellulosilytica]